MLSALIYFEIVLLNKFTWVTISTHLRISDILVGLTIYLKTAVDFGIFIGNLMVHYRSWQSRVAIEIGTAIGNAFGTIMILAVWSLAKNINWLLALMMLFASLVLLKLAEDGLNIKLLKKINRAVEPVLKFIIPNLSLKPKSGLKFFGLFASAFTIPFILGLDDFAGYLPIFNIVNVFGFSVGVLAGHMILNIALFISPKKTISVVKNPVISLGGSLLFVGLALWGIYEVLRLIIK